MRDWSVFMGYQNTSKKLFFSSKVPLKWSLRGLICDSVFFLQNHILEIFLKPCSGNSYAINNNQVHFISLVCELFSFG